MRQADGGTRLLFCLIMFHVKHMQFVLFCEAAVSPHAKDLTMTYALMSIQKITRFLTKNCCKLSYMCYTKDIEVLQLRKEGEGEWEK